MTDALNLIQEVERIRETALAEIAGASDAAALEAVRIQHLARKAPLTAILRGLKDVSPAERGRVGQAANQAKVALEAALAEKETALSRGVAVVREDPTLPGVRPPHGHAHLLTQTEERILDIFRGMGFAVARGPDVEDDYHNFEALNFPKGHPARDMQDTFFASENILLRTHTSPVQIRSMESTPPPIRMAFPGRVYRREAQDATHSSEFHQVELLYVDRGVTMQDLKGTLTRFAHEMFGGHLDVRFRPSYFPFVEPGGRWTSPASSARERAAGSASRAAGSRSWGRAWSIPGCCATSATIPSRSRATPPAWAWSASPCCATASPTSASSSRTISASSPSSSSPARVVGFALHIAPAMTVRPSAERHDRRARAGETRCASA